MIIIGVMGYASDPAPAATVQAAIIEGNYSPSTHRILRDFLIAHPTPSRYDINTIELEMDQIKTKEIIANEIRAASPISPSFVPSSESTLIYPAIKTTQPRDVSKDMSLIEAFLLVLVIFIIPFSFFCFMLIN